MHVIGGSANGPIPIWLVITILAAMPILAFMLFGLVMLYTSLENKFRNKFKI